jgi:hypothetical protein
MKTKLNPLAKFANADMRLAKKHGAMCIAQTKRGNVDVEWNGAEFTVSGAEVNWTTGDVKPWSVKGAAAEIREFLCGLYVVTA